MPSIRYVNQSAPFWDFIASFENQDSAHPFAARSGEAQESSEEEGHRGFGRPHSWMGPGGRRDWHRGPQHEGHRHPHPPHAEDHHHPPPHHEGSPPPGFHQEGATPHPESEFDSPRNNGPPHPHHHRGRGGRRGGRHGPFGHHGRGQGPPPMGGPFDFGGLAALFQRQLFGQGPGNGEERDIAHEGFKPEADVFNTESSYVIHLSLPGAKKEDISVNWDAEKSELSIAGVVHRPGDEDFIKTLDLDERKVGAFDRKIRLGSRANPAQVDADAVTAKLEDGILRVEVPKLDRDYVEIRKVDIE